MSAPLPNATQIDGSSNGHDVVSGRFTVGHSEYRAKQRRLEERLAQLCQDYDPSPSQRQLLVVIARHLDDAERARRAVTRTRAANAAKRLLADIPRRPAPEPPQPTTLAAYSKQRGAA